MSAWLVVLATDESDVTPGLLGFVVVALLGLATYLLIRSMNRQIRRIDLPEDDRADEGGRADEEEPPAGAGR
jgi:hypothetical protein